MDQPPAVIDAPAQRPVVSDRERLVWWSVWGVLGVVLIGCEIVRYYSLPAEVRSVWTWLEPVSLDTTLWLGWWVCFPWLWFWQRRPIPLTTSTSTNPASVTRFDWGCAILVAALAYGMSWYVGARFGPLPPAYHDEYSYLVQAETIRSGSIYHPGEKWMPHLFDQMHVLNEGRFVSRYYPGTGLWLAPWVRSVVPQQGQWLAQTLIVWLTFWIGRRLGGRLCGLLASLLCALSPGLVLFSNLLLAHHPCLLGVAVAYYGYVIRTGLKRVLPILLISLGICQATICRPATGVALGIPLAVGVLRDLLSDSSWKQWGNWLRLLGAGLGPVLLTMAAMLCYHKLITDDFWTSPYQLYTNLYTPRHVYGFANVTRGAAAQGDRQLPIVTRKYDAWAEELTVPLAVRNLGLRILASGRWTLGLVPLGLCVVLWWCRPGGVPAGSVVLWGGILTLHLIHVPYWFTGIMHWHYVFESAWLWCLLCGWWLAETGRDWWRRGTTGRAIWLLGGVMLCILLNWISLPPFWYSRMDQGIAEIRFAREKYANFNRDLEQHVWSRPALVLIEPDPADLHFDLVTNPSAFGRDIWRGRYVPGEVNLDEILQMFQERTIYLYQSRTRSWQLLQLKRSFR